MEDLPSNSETDPQVRQLSSSNWWNNYKMLITFTVLFFFFGASLADHDLDQVGDWVVVSDWEEDQPAKSLEKSPSR